MSQKTERKLRAMFRVFFAAVLLGVVLCGCGTAATADDPPPGIPSTSEDAVSGRAEDSVAAEDSAPADKFVATEDSDIAEEPVAAGNSDPEDSAPGEIEPEPGSVEGVKAVAEMSASVEDIAWYGRYCAVNVEDEHNPYDVVWDYGEDYRKFVDAVDAAGMWDVLFDAEFYKKNYPMLAMLYHDDDALLLEHFQTVGVHEGRQASEAFNVAAYMENCDSSLTDAFGDHYECYYFYWALNQTPESGVPTKSDGHPIQMCVKMTALQRIEFEHVNEYRVEAGAPEAAVDPELLALANYRAWVDFTGGYTAHEWLDTHGDEMDDYLEMFDAWSIAENTVCGSCNAYGPGHIGGYYLNYYFSEDHYNAMVSKKYAYFGCSNVYWGPDGKGGDGYKHCQYDVYLDQLSTHMHP